MAWGKRREGGGCSTPPAGGHRVWEGEACGLASPFATCRALVDRLRVFACSLMVARSLIIFISFAVTLSLIHEISRSLIHEITRSLIHEVAKRASQRR